MTTKQMSFAGLEVMQRLLPDTILVKLNALTDWEAFRPLLKGVYKRDLSNGAGQQPDDVQGDPVTACPIPRWKSRPGCGSTSSCFAAWTWHPACPTRPPYAGSATA